MDLLTPILKRLEAATEAEVRAISEATGVPAATIAKIKYRQTPNPRVRTVQKLYAHLIEVQ
jgi:saccharopine dehydrogenase-like NADP-dependent oxidoreductase